MWLIITTYFKLLLDTRADGTQLFWPANDIFVLMLNVVARSERVVLASVCFHGSVSVCLHFRRSSRQIRQCNCTKSDKVWVQNIHDCETNSALFVASICHRLYDWLESRPNKAKTAGFSLLAKSSTHEDIGTTPEEKYLPTQTNRWTTHHSWLT